MNNRQVLEKVLDDLEQELPEIYEDEHEADVAVSTIYQVGELDYNLPTDKFLDQLWQDLGGNSLYDMPEVDRDEAIRIAVKKMIFDKVDMQLRGQNG